MSGLSIDPEFRDLIPPLSKEEYAGLESSLKEFGCHTAIITWDGIIIDGHNRFEICTKYGIEFDELEWPFTDRREARIWILDNQLSRRNISETVRMDLALLLKSETQAQAQERSGANLKRGGNSPDGPKSDPRGKTDAILAAKAGVGKTKLRDYEAVKETGTPELVKATQDGKLSVHAAAKAAKLLTPEEQIEAMKAAPGKIGEVVRAEVAKAEAQKKEIAEANAWVDKMNATFQKPDFDPKKERQRVHITHKLYNAIEAITSLPEQSQVIAMVPEWAEHKLDNLNDAIQWLVDFQKLYKEKHNEDLATTA
jgi:hypothetical protein